MATTLFILQGAPGCGKSTFVHDNELDDYVISPDAFREVINPHPLVVDEKTGWLVEGYDFSPHTSSLAFDMAEKVTNKRMIDGDTIILDLTASRRKTISKFLHLAQAHRYDVVYVQCQKGLSLEEVIRRNESRGRRAVPRSVVETMYQRVEDYAYHDDELVVGKEGMLDLLITPISDMSGHDAVHVIGDVQGCFSRLMMTGIKEDLENAGSTDVWVFSGDLLDRGDMEAETFDFILDHLDDERLIVVKGNHDDHWRYYNNDVAAPYGRPTKRTIADILKRSSHVGGNVRTLRRLTKEAVSKFLPFLAFTYHGERYFISHGGLHPTVIRTMTDDSTMTMRSGLLSDSMLYYGSGRFVGRGDYGIDIDALISKEWREDDFIQFHGHRNEFGHTADKFPHVYNLESKVEEKDGHLTMATIRGDSVKVEIFS